MNLKWYQCFTMHSGLSQQIFHIPLICTIYSSKYESAPHFIQRNSYFSPELYFSTDSVELFSTFFSPQNLIFVNHQNLFVKFKCDLSRKWKLLIINNSCNHSHLFVFFAESHNIFNDFLFLSFFWRFFFEDIFLYVFIQNLLEAILYNQFPVNPVHRCV